MRKYSYGLEWELGDTDMTKSIPEGWTISGDPDVLNTNPPAACDPELKDYFRGAEFNSKPCYSINEITELCRNLIETYPEASVTHKQVIHAHISWPEIRDDLDDLKRFLNYVDQSYDWITSNIWHYDLSHPKMNKLARQFLSFDVIKMPDWRKAFCDAAATVNDFKNAHSRVRDGRYLPQTTKRYYINMYPVFKPQKTIEFRNFFPSTSPAEIEAVFEFISRFTDEALSDNPAHISTWGGEFKARLPQEKKYDHRLEMIWQKTNFKFNDRTTANKNRDLIFGGLDPEQDLSEPDVTSFFE